MLQWIDDIPRNAVMNMALDEVLFNKYKNEPILRVYGWDNSYTTIGYFQKVESIAEVEFVRRFTGGLTVNHCNDISYSFIVSLESWNIYSQSETYRNIHLVIQKVLRLFGINSIILCDKVGNMNNMCVQTFYENDLILGGKKIVGSCLRRRKNKLMVQGAIHVNLNYSDKKKFSRDFAKNLAELLKIEVKKENFTDDDIESAKKISNEKYLNPQWNNMF
jgi:lipoate-protein ligase A